MEHIEFSGGLTPGQLGERLGLSSGAITALADRMERAGWLRRVPHPSDRRSTLLCMTKAADKVCEGIWGPFGAEMRAAAARLSARELAAVTRFFDEATAVCDRHAERLQSSSEASSSGSVTGRKQANRSQT